LLGRIGKRAEIPRLKQSPKSVWRFSFSLMEMEMKTFDSFPDIVFHLHLSKALAGQQSIPRNRSVSLLNFGRFCHLRHLCRQDTRHGMLI
jgi:hypothetical protein